MECMHSLRERVEDTLSAAFEVYGRALYAIDDRIAAENPEAEADAAHSVIADLLGVSETLDEYFGDVDYQETSEVDQGDPIAVEE